MTLPVRKYLPLWLNKRTNNPGRARTDGKKPSTSYTLHWRVHGNDQYLSLGTHATWAYAEECRRRKEEEINSFQQQSTLVPSTGMTSSPST